MDDLEHSCYIKELPESTQKHAAQSAAKIYSPNAPLLLSPQAAAAWDAPSNLAYITLKYWGPKPIILTVSFLESPQADLRAKILEHMNAWKCSVTFEQASPGTAGDVRISLQGKGFWSYLGTNILQVPRNQPTMNLEGFSISTSDAEYRRVVRHETGHTLGFPHEQLRKEIVGRIDHQKAYEYFRRTSGFSKKDVDSNVLTPIDDNDLTGTLTDSTSIMCYHLPAGIMNDHIAVEGGDDINTRDFEFCQDIYPPSPAAPRRTSDLPVKTADISEEDWSRKTSMPVQPSTCVFNKPLP